MFLYLICAISNAQYKSEDGDGLSPRGTIRTLNIFINIIYDFNPALNPYPNNDAFWPYDTIEGVTTIGPTYFTDWLDVNYTPSNVHGTQTRIYYESSLGNLIVLGDMIVVNIKHTSIDPYGGGFDSDELVDSCNALINNNGVHAKYGHDSFSDYETNGDNKVDAVQYFCRNGTGTYGLDYPIGGYVGHTGTLIFNGIPHKVAFFTFQQARANQDISKDYKQLSIHEFAHNLFGGNNFHTSGGNHYTYGFTCTFMGKQGGWGLMGGQSSLVTCNAFERWRMNWTSLTYNPDSIRIQANRVNSDIDNTSGHSEFYLRDFVSTGDAIRIKLPYKDSAICSNQYIWLENHQIGRNNKLDFFKFKDEACIPEGTPGIYAYYQIGKDIISGSSSNVWTTLEQDNLKIISAEGNWDMIFDGSLNDCPNWDSRTIVKQIEENPLSGYNDQMTALYNTHSNTLNASADANYALVKKFPDNSIDTSLPAHGDNYDAFTNNSKIGIGTNPAAFNTVTYYANQNGGIIRPATPARNNRRIYLNGLQILFEVSGSNQFGDIYKVTIDWDKYDVDENRRWTGDIVLKEDVIIKSGTDLTINQNRTPNQRDRVSSTKEFAEASNFTCENGSFFQVEANSTVTVDENSTFTLESGSTLEIEDMGRFIVTKESDLIVKNGATINIKGRGELIIQLDAMMCVEPGAMINLQATDSKISFNSNGKLNPACLTDLSSVTTGSGLVVQNIKSFIKVGDSTKICISGNSIFNLNNGGYLEIDDGGRFVVTNNSKFNVKNGATIAIKGNGELVIKCGAQMYVETGVKFWLKDANSKIRIINSGSLSDSGLTNLSSIITGNGSVVQYHDAVVLNDQTFATDRYFSGTTITSTNVNILTGNHVVYDASGAITINGTFNAPLGASFETRSNGERCDE